MKYFVTLIMLLGLLSAAAKNDDIDYLQLAALMLRDGHVARAADALHNVDTNASDLDKGRYFMLKGLVETKQGDYRTANEDFYRCIDASEDANATKPLYLYIAQNSFRLKDYAGCIEALEHVPQMTRENPKLLSLEAECYWRENDHEKALALLRTLNRLHPKYYDAYKQRFYYLVSLHLYQAALDDAKTYLKNAKANETILLNFINALRRSGQTDKAIALAEKAHLRYPNSVKITVMLAHLYLDKEMVVAAAGLFDEASLQDRKFTKESAEMYRRARDFVMALYKNTQMLDTKEKYRQRLAIFLEYGDYERVIAARDALRRSGLMKEEPIRYALAYAYYMEGDFDRAEALLKTLSKPDLFKKAIELRKKMDACRHNVWECEQ